MTGSFGKIIEENNTKTKTSRLICVSMLAAGVILLAFIHTIGWLFTCMGIVLAVSLINKDRRMRAMLALIDDMDGFCRQFDSEDSTHLELLGLTVMPDYTVLTLPYLQIFRHSDMEKFEVGLQGDVRKALFLTDRSGTRHRIAETQKGDALQEEFDRAYEAVRAIFAGRQA